jgi:site-specific DNA-methyltransferase (adenine-specific)
MDKWLNQIICGDNVEVMRQMPDNCIDLTVTSPPYDNLRTYNGFSFNFEEVAKELYRITKDGGVVVWVVGDATINGSETGTSFRQALYFKEIGFNLHDTMIYAKRNPMPITPKAIVYRPCFEYMFVFSKGKPKTFNPLMIEAITAGTKVRASTRQKDGSIKEPTGKRETQEFIRRTNIWEYKVGMNQTTKDKVAFEHPAPFPEQLAKDHIISWSNPRDLVFDPFSGSGTTAKMALLEGRNYLGIDISGEYCGIARQRLEQAQTQQRLFAEA